MDGAQVARVDQGTLRWADGRIELERDGETAWSYGWESTAERGPGGWLHYGSGGLPY